ncbi:cation-translocating P-type ATPase [Variovorax dokdonensis]|uniref:Cation-translocating P-type ATPase n=1 Tax=Variovorax dokdonensis TaxID=344883 RepID=A0ABT7NAT9_9BURK|nr:cation-translocating P-type ATPase [Variovorax dokdonensis]MDM0045060.1 cation-translocating P-type ATPase [Variovorax dokdonensis]
MDVSLAVGPPLADAMGGAAAAPQRARDHASDLSQAIDDPQHWSSFSRPLGSAAVAAAGHAPPQRWESHFVVRGMHCAACAFQLESALAGLPGVERVDVDARHERARVRWVSGATRPSQWVRAAAAAGYGLAPAGDLQAREQRRRDARTALWRWLVAGLCMMQVMMYAYPAYTARPGELSADSAQLLRWASWVLCLPVLFFSSGPFFRGALRDLRRRSIGMDLPVALGIGITFVVSSVATFDPGGPLGQEVYFDSLSMFVFFLLSGRLIEARLKERTAIALQGLTADAPQDARRRRADGLSFERVAIGQLALGDVLQVLPGERFPADGRLIDGDTLVDEALLTGESHPLPRARGELVLAGSHNLSAAVQMQVKALGADTRLAGIAALMDSAAFDKPRLVQLADRVARPFLLFVVVAAALAAALWWPEGHGQALMVAVSVLIVTCPCALSLAAPSSMLASAGAMAREGVLVRELQSLEALAGIDTVVFDKTGTLTREPARLDRIYCRRGLRPREALERAAVMAAASLHPAARGLAEAWHAVAEPALDRWRLVHCNEHGGQGLQASLRLHGDATARPHSMRLGSAAWCGVSPLDVASIQVHLSDEQGWAASFVLVEDLRPDAADTVARLRAQGLQVHLLSGDRVEAAAALAQRIGIEHVRGGCRPEDKLDHLRALQAQGRRVLMVGDGINDGPVLARADVSMAFGRQAAPLAQQRADLIVLGERLATVESSWLQARKTLSVIRQNLGWAAAYNFVCVPIALAGWLPAWLAGLGMALSSLVVVANAARLSRPAPSVG